MNNRQLRSWVFLLYPDNPKHIKAIKYLDHLQNSLYIKHEAKYTDQGEMLNKEHYHCILRYDKPTWLSSLLSELGLSEEDEHLFHSYKDFKTHGKPKYKSLDEYANYLDHIETDKPDKYNIDNFQGGLKDWVRSIINKRENNNMDNFIEMCEFIHNYHLDNFIDTRSYSFQKWFMLCVNNGYGKTFWDNWYKMRDILKSYIQY